MRRVHVDNIRPGVNALQPPAAHYLVDVLRLGSGDHLEAFDDAGRWADATLIASTPGQWALRVEAIAEPRPDELAWTVASAVPKGERADWLVEKLSELGVTSFVPLLTARSVVIPQGEAKLKRWHRIASESARQSRRTGVMRIAALTALSDFITSAAPGWYLSTEPGALAASDAVKDFLRARSSNLSLLVGPEGGWTEEERYTLQHSGLTAVSLGATILRVETAAVASAAIVAGILLPSLRQLASSKAPT